MRTDWLDNLAERSDDVLRVLVCVFMAVMMVLLTVAAIGYLPKAFAGWFQ